MIVPPDSRTSSRSKKRTGTDESEIRTLIERWDDTVHAGSMDGVVADHARDIVMFDVPPPDEGVLGIEA